MRGDATFPRPSPEVVDRFRGAVEGIEGVEVRKMFGMPAAFVNGNMAASVFGDAIAVRLPEAERASRSAEGWPAFEPMPGRTMREYVGVPDAVVSDPDALRALIEQAVAFVRELPAKAPRAAARRRSG